MGCCASQPLQQEALPPPKERLAATRVLPDKVAAGGLRVFTSTAALSRQPADPRSFTRALIGDRYILSSVFDGLLGDDACARFCTKRVFHVFSETLRLHGGASMTATLQRTLQQLDKDFLADSSIPAKVRATSGASAALAVIDLAAMQVHCASVGNSFVVLGQRVGGFASSTSAPKVLTHPDHTDSLLALHDELSAALGRHEQALKAASAAQGGGKGGKQPSARRAEAYAVPPGSVKSSAGGAGAGTAPGAALSDLGYAPESDTSAPSALGYGAGKSFALASAAAAALLPEAQLRMPALVPGATGAGAASGSGTNVSGGGASSQQRHEGYVGLRIATTTCELGRLDESVLLLSGGMAQALSPWDAALLAHMFEVGQIYAARPNPQPTLTSAALPGSGGGSEEEGGAPSGNASPAAVAGRHAPWTAQADSLVGGAESAATAGGRGGPFNVARALVSYAAAKVAGAQGGGGGRGQKGKAVKGLPPPALAAGADLACVAVRLEWPGSVHMASLDAMRALKAASERPVAYHWMLLRAHCKFYTRRHKPLLDRWRDAHDALVARALKAARAKELVAWKVLGEAVQVSKAGAVTRLEATPTHGAAAGASAGTTPVRSSAAAAAAAASPSVSSVSAAHAAAAEHHAAHDTVRPSPSRGSSLKKTPSQTRASPAPSGAGAGAGVGVGVGSSPAPASSASRPRVGASSLPHAPSAARATPTKLASTTPAASPPAHAPAAATPPVQRSPSGKSGAALTAAATSPRPGAAAAISPRKPTSIAAAGASGAPPARSSPSASTSAPSGTVRSPSLNATAGRTSHTSIPSAAPASPSRPSPTKPSHAAAAAAAARASPRAAVVTTAATPRSPTARPAADPAPAATTVQAAGIPAAAAAPPTPPLALHIDAPASCSPVPSPPPAHAPAGAAGADVSLNGADAAGTAAGGGVSGGGAGLGLGLGLEDFPDLLSPSDDQLMAWAHEAAAALGEESHASASPAAQSGAAAAAAMSAALQGADAHVKVAASSHGAGGGQLVSSKIPASISASVQRPSGGGAGSKIPQAAVHATAPAAAAHAGKA